MTLLSSPPVESVTATLRTSLRPDIAVRSGERGILVGGDRTGPLPVRPSAAAAAVLAALAEPVTEAELAEQVVAAAGETGLLDMHMLLSRLLGAGFVEHRLTDAVGDSLARLRVVGQGATKLGAAPAADGAAKLSRFAQAAVDGDTLSVRSPRSGLALDLDPRVAGVLGLLAQWRTPAELDELLPAGTAVPLLRMFATAGLLAAGTESDPAEVPSSAGGQWTSADLWLHAHTRAPRASAGYGGTYHGKGVREPVPVRTDDHGWPVAVTFEAPDLDAVAAADPSFTDVLERRRSRRVHDEDAPLTKAQLGELLFRTARLRRSFAGTDGEEVADRPYPSGGATHELELYPLVSNVEGIAPGLYHYRSDTHALELVAEPDKTTAGLVARARVSAVMTTDPQVVLLVSARFGRVMYKYETIAYSLILKHVGVLYQTIYLVGEAMGLAVCGLGGGDAELFAGVTGLDFLTEGTVGELVLGSASSSDAAEASWRGEDSVVTGAPS